MLLVVLAVAWEGLLRSQGRGIDFVDRAALWATIRDRLQRADVALLGSSRMHRDGHLPSFESILQRDTRMLAVEGASALPALEHLADESPFAGLVIFDVTPTIEFSQRTALVSNGRQSEWIDLYRRTGRVARWERQWAHALRSRHALFGDRVHLGALVSAWLDGELLPPVPYKSLDGRRQVHIRDHVNPQTPQDLVNLQSKLIAPLSADQVSAYCQRMATAASRIQQRGGAVVLVRLPSSDAVRAMERDLLPREQYWDALVDCTSLPAIHFEDHVSLQGFASMDGSHLTTAEAPVFSTRLAIRVRQRLGEHGWFGPP